MIISDYEFSTPVSNACMVPKSVGVYAIIIDSEIEYIGKTENLYRRFCEHKCKKFREENFVFSFLECSRNQLNEIEQFLISEVKPFRNKLDVFELKKRREKQHPLNLKIRKDSAEKLELICELMDMPKYQAIEFLIEEFNVS